MHKITVMGTSVRLYDVKNEKGFKILLRTKISDAAAILDKNNIRYDTLDNVYENAQDFDSLDALLAQEVKKAAQNQNICYIVPGSAVTSDGSVRELLDMCEDVDVIYGDAPEYAFLAAAGVSLAQGYAMIPAACLERGMFSPRLALIVTALDNEYMLGDVKILLSDEYGDEHEAIIGDGQSHVKAKLYEIDRYKDVSHKTMIYIPPKTESARYDSYELQEVFKKLRSPEGCPWDREQDHVSLKRYLLEECAEVLEAIDNGDMAELMDELGDVLLQVLFHATIAEERGDFDMRDVTDNLVRKLIKRHPHVFADAKAENPDEVLKQWDAIKHEEKEDKSHTAKLKSVPKAMTALMRAQKVLSRAEKSEIYNGAQKLEIITSLKKRMDRISQAEGEAELYRELGEMMFDAAGLSRAFGIEGELALNAATDRFIDGFHKAEFSKKNI